MQFDNDNNVMYTRKQVEEIARQAAEIAASQALSLVNLDNSISEPAMPTMEGEENMARQRVHVTLPTGENVWITGATFSDLIQNALNKYGSCNTSQYTVSSESFGEYTDKIFDVFLVPRWKPSTANTNRFLLDKHILPYFGDVSLSNIDVALVQQFFQTKQHLSKSYTKQMLIMLHEIFENAIEDGKMSSDPTQSKRITLPQKATKRNALEPEQFFDIISHLNDLDQNDSMFVAMLCFTGMRRGEILGLKWDCVADNKIVVKAEVIFKGNQPVFNEYTKSASGVREIPITKELARYLVNRGNGFVFGGESPYTQSKFDRMWQRIRKKINLYGTTPHVFRHTYLSMLAASNVDPKTIQALAGHSDFSFTFNKYIDSNKMNMLDAGSQFSEQIDKLTQKLTHRETHNVSIINGSDTVNSMIN